MPDLRDRINRFERLPAGQLMDHTGNWRRHPQHQRAVVTAVLTEIGIADALLVYHSQVHGGLTILDGHLRRNIAPDQAWPCLVLDVDDAEAAVLLTTIDTTTALAETDRDALTLLLGTIQAQETALVAFLADLQHEHAPDTDPPNLSDMSEQYTEPDERDFWPTITLALPPDTHRQYLELLIQFPGEDEAAKFTHLLQAAEQGVTHAA